MTELLTITVFLGAFAALGKLLVEKLFRSGEGYPADPAGPLARIPIPVHRSTDGRRGASGPPGIRGRFHLRP